MLPVGDGRCAAFVDWYVSVDALEAFHLEQMEALADEDGDANDDGEGDPEDTSPCHSMSITDCSPLTRTFVAR